jgi:hypothetical protein
MRSEPAFESQAGRTRRGGSSIQSYRHERINGGRGEILPSGYGNQIDSINKDKATGLVREGGLVNH